MMRAALQLHINLGAADHLNVLHHAHNSNLVIATAFGGEWHERCLKKDDAIDVAKRLEENRVSNSYVTQNAIKFGSKTKALANLSCLANCFIDLDTYNVPALLGMDKADILQLIIQSFPDMPRPTLFADSGRGIYLIWTFKNTKPVAFIPAWQVIENNLAELLKPFGADPKCRDASRVLRISGTENSKSLTLASYEQIGDPVKFEDLQKFSNKLSAKNKPKKYTNNVKKLNTGFGTSTKNVYTLAYSRMGDIRKLAELRGGRFTDLRKTAMYIYSACAAWFCPTVEPLESELESFVFDCIASPHEYLKIKPTTVYKRKQDSIESVTVTWQGRECDARYRYRTDTLIKLLEITPEEQRHLKCIIGKAEKYDRKNAKRTEKRRVQGVVERHKYEQAAQERAQQALDLLAKGKSRADIASLLGVSMKSVSRYLKVDKCGSLYL